MNTATASAGPSLQRVLVFPRDGSRAGESSGTFLANDGPLLIVRIVASRTPAGPLQAEGRFIDRSEASGGSDGGR